MQHQQVLLARALVCALVMIGQLFSSAALSSEARDATNPEVQAVKKAMEDRLADPFSAEYRNVRVGQDPEGEPGSLLVCGRVNAKNRMGAYVGFTRFVGAVFPRPGVPLVYIIAVDKAGDAIVDQMCRDRGLT